MSLFALIKSYSPFLTLVIAIFGPSLLPRFLSLLSRKSRPRFSSPKSARAPTPIYLKALLALHSLYQIYTLLSPPYDLFTSNHLPILTSNEKLRLTSLRDTSTSTLHPLTELLLQRLQSLDNRYHYARFGHQPLLSCVWCTSKLDFLIAAVPGILGVYLIQAGILGIMGWEWVGGMDAARRSERWRSVFGWSLGVLAVGEGMIRYWWDIRAVEGDCLHVR
jgi:hypothetical protein